MVETMLWCTQLHRLEWNCRPRIPHHVTWLVLWRP